MSCKIAVVSHRMGATIQENLSLMDDFIFQGAASNADLILFSETATTGLINNDDPLHDLPLGIPIPGDITDHFTALARHLNIHIALGLFEREADHLFDTAILLDRKGKIVLHYRRMSKGWHWPKSDPDVYREGNQFPTVELDIGKVSFLICGDLFDEKILQNFFNVGGGLLLVPYARTVEGIGNKQMIWEKEDLPAYQEIVSKIAVPTCFSGYIDEEYIGGSMVINAQGKIVKALPLQQEGLLFVDF